MGRADDVRDPLFRLAAHEIERLPERLGTVVHAEEDMGVDVRHPRPSPPSVCVRRYFSEWLP